MGIYTSGIDRTNPTHLTDCEDGLLSPFCTMSWRPSRDKTGRQKDKLYHSVKPRQMVEPVTRRMEYLYIWLMSFVRFNLLKRTD